MTTVDPIGTVRKRPNATGVKVNGGWVVVWTLFTEPPGGSWSSFYSDDDLALGADAEWIQGGALVAEPSQSERGFRPDDDG